jgi:hypothetical protein
MFISDKALTMLLLPTAFMVECALLGLLPGRRPIRRANLIAAIGALTVCVILARQFLDHSAVGRSISRRYGSAGGGGRIVVLGGAIDDLTSRDRGKPRSRGTRLRRGFLSHRLSFPVSTMSQ